MAKGGGTGGGDIIEGIGRLLAPQTTQGFLNAPLERQTRERAIGQGSALDELISGLTGGQAAQSMNVNGANVNIPAGALKMSTQVMGPQGAPIGPVGPVNALNASSLPSSSGMGRFMADRAPMLAMQADPETTLKAVQANLIDTPQIKEVAPGATIGSYTRAGGFQPGYTAPMKLGPMDMQKFQEEQRHNRATESAAGWVESKDAFGNPVIINKMTGESKTPTGMQSVSNDDVESTAQMIANYQKKPATGAAAMRPFNLSIMKRVSELNPDYNEQFYNSSNSARTKFSSGKEGTLTRQANVATSHLATLDAIGQSLQTGNVQTANRLMNKLGVEFGNPNVSSYEDVAPLVADEVAKFIMGGQTAVADRAEFAKALTSAKSPQQRQATINAWKGLMVGQLHGLKRQYETETRSKDFGDKLDPDVKELLDNPTYAPGSNPNAAKAPSGAPAEARQGNDGGWYTPDPSRPGKYLKWQ